MPLPDYNPEGKKLTWQQHLRAMQKQKEEETERIKQNGGKEKPWLCQCGQSRFTLQAKEGKLYRTCKACDQVEVF